MDIKIKTNSSSALSHDDIKINIWCSIKPNNMYLLLTLCGLYQPDRLGHAVWVWSNMTYAVTQADSWLTYVSIH